MNGCPDSHVSDRCSSINHTKWGGNLYTDHLSSEARLAFDMIQPRHQQKLK